METARDSSSINRLRLRIQQLMADATNSALLQVDLDQNGYEQVISNSDKILERLRTIFLDLSVATSEPQEHYGYLSGYRLNRDQSIEVILADFENQVRLLDSIFNCGMKYNPDLIVRYHAICPNWVEKFFAQIDWRIVGPTYNAALSNLLHIINQTRTVRKSSLRQFKIGPDDLRQTERTASKTKDLRKQFTNESVQIVPAQFGLRHSGLSENQARQAFEPNEYGLGSFAVGIMLLTHPERLQHKDDLRVICAGDEHYGEQHYERNKIPFSHIPIFYFEHRRLGLFGFSKTHSGASYGVVTAYMPE